jgi:hypothetical protein
MQQADEDFMENLVREIRNLSYSGHGMCAVEGGPVMECRVSGCLRFAPLVKPLNLTALGILE